MKIANLKRKVFIFDFDGTLSPLVSDRKAAKIHPACRELLTALAANPQTVTAVMSSRTLRDIESRVDIPNIYLGGSSGTCWKCPTGAVVEASYGLQARLEVQRSIYFDKLKKIAEIYGAELEDKEWSVALHLRDAAPGAKKGILFQLDELGHSLHLGIYEGPDVLEIMFLPETNKAAGVRELCRLISFDFDNDTIFYAGDDENDVFAMALVRSFGGSVLTVGKSPLLPMSQHVASQPDLVAAVAQLAWPVEDEGDLEVIEFNVAAPSLSPRQIS